ncbi:MAG: hypothetical protein ABW198_12245 [Pseudorhodoplanes sp.]
MHKLDLGNLDGLAGLAGLADHSGLDIRPTLLRVLTDLYVQKPSHGPEEERHYIELALRLIEDVDAGTCAAVAASLSKYPAAPAEVMQRLAPIAALGYPKASVKTSGPAITARNVPAKILPDDEDDDLFEPEPPSPDIFEPDIFEPLPVTAPNIAPGFPPLAAPDPAGFVELRETFFDADAQTRRLILISLEAVASPHSPALASGTNIMRYLEQAALAGRRQEFATLLQQSLGVSRALTMRIVTDALGEPFAVAGRALAMPSDVFQRILMFLNPEIGQSVQRVYELADLFLDLPQDSALHLVAIWRAADRAEARALLHKPLLRPERGKNAPGHAAPERKAAQDQAVTGNTQRRA